MKNKSIKRGKELNLNLVLLGDCHFYVRGAPSDIRKIIAGKINLDGVSLPLHSHYRMIRNEALERLE